MLLLLSMAFSPHHTDFMKPGQNWKWIQAHHWVQHPDFNNENFHNDTMLLKLSHSAELTEWVRPIPLPEINHHVSPGSECSVNGRSQTGVNTTTNRLLEAEQEVVSDGLCKGWYQHYDSTTVLCTSSSHAKKSAFQVNIPPPGDTGGPLVCDGKAQDIVSYGKPDGSAPQVFTRVSKYISWIKTAQADAINGSIHLFSHDWRDS
ncbi:duodenase-1-like [Terrapene carolina triunguis]|uniref:duodenase-1-like n=1 Tax=Terrapene triunguis TaxID=2587831 RepID=UPI000E77F4AD|nr:duodenase-1-like [Terrapene carolina triunguis]